MLGTGKQHIVAALEHIGNRMGRSHKQKGKLEMQHKDLAASLALVVEPRKPSVRIEGLTLVAVLVVHLNTKDFSQRL